MSANARAPSRATAAAGAAKRSYFEQQREILMGEIALSFEHVLANMNKLNRSLEAVITVGNEFSSVEALWSQFEGVMAKESEATAEDGAGADADRVAENEADEADEADEANGADEADKADKADEADEADEADMAQRQKR